MQACLHAGGGQTSGSLESLNNAWQVLESPGGGRQQCLKPDQSHCSWANLLDTSDEGGKAGTTAGLHGPAFCSPSSTWRITRQLTRIPRHPYIPQPTVRVQGHARQKASEASVHHSTWTRPEVSGARQPFRAGAPGGGQRARDGPESASTRPVCSSDDTDTSCVFSGQSNHIYGL